MELNKKWFYHLISTAFTLTMFTLFRKKKTCCWVEGKSIGILGYVDDLLLLSPILDGLQEMIKSCGEYARHHNLSFSMNVNLMKCKTKEPGTRNEN